MQRVVHTLQKINENSHPAYADYNQPAIYYYSYML